MPRGTLLTLYERGQISALRSTGESINQIAKTLKRSRCVIKSFIDMGEDYGENRFHGAKPKLSGRDKRAIFREVSNKAASCTEIKAKLNLPVSPETIRLHLHSEKTLKYCKKKRKPLLTGAAKANRLAWARAKVGWGQEWAQIIFSDEKKFNLDGPDGFRNYWHDLRKEPIIFSKRHSGTGTVMIWGAFSSKGKSELAFISPNSTALHYQRMLTTTLLPCWNRIGGPGTTLMEDNAPIHKARSTKAWFQGQNIPVLAWAPYSPDLNPIENVWGLLARKVYANGRQFQTPDDLKRQIQISWNEIGQQYLDTLLDSMPRRIAAVLEARGGATKY